MTQDGDDITMTPDTIFSTLMYQGVSIDCVRYATRLEGIDISNTLVCVMLTLDQAAVLAAVLKQALPIDSLETRNGRLSFEWGGDNVTIAFKQFASKDVACPAAVTLIRGDRFTLEPIIRTMVDTRIKQRNTKQ